MLDRKEIPISDGTIVEPMDCFDIQPIVLDLPEGAALCHPAVSFTMITAIQPNGCGKFIMAIAVGNFAGQRLGVLSPMTANQARSFAASLIAGADEIDGRGGLS